MNVLQNHGYEAFAVGGCVRDTVLGRAPDDWDITTSAHPQEVKRLFVRTVDTGLAHGTVTVLLGEDSYEVTTYRIDGAYEDHRHPSQVQFSAELAEDLRRRDFTINAMAYNQEQGLVDLFGGMQDLQKKRICCVGDAHERFQEDALRILRAVRFSAQLGFSIESDTEKALRELAQSLSYVSEERIQAELVKLLLSAHPDYVLRLFDTGIASVILPEMEASEETARSLCRIPPEKPLRLALFLHALGEKKAERLLRLLKFDNHTIDTVRKLVRWRKEPITADPACVRRAAAKIGIHLFPMVLQMQEIDRDVSEILTVWEEVVREGQCISLNSLAVSGNDLIALGMKPGQRIGKALNELLGEVLEKPEYNTREYLLESVKRKWLQ